MKRTKLSIALCLSLGLTGCVWTGADYTDEVQAVQVATAKACKFVPTVATVIGIVSAGDPVLTSVAVIATKICEAFAKAQLTASNPPSYFGLYSNRSHDCERVAGVCVEGFVIKEPGKHGSLDGDANIADEAELTWSGDAYTVLTIGELGVDDHQSARIDCPEGENLNMFCTIIYGPKH